MFYPISFPSSYVPETDSIIRKIEEAVAMMYRNKSEYKSERKYEKKNLTAYFIGKAGDAL